MSSSRDPQSVLSEGIDSIYYEIFGWRYWQYILWNLTLVLGIRLELGSEKLEACLGRTMGHHA